MTRDRRRLFGGHGIAVDDLGLKRPSLDDVFLHLTGHRAESDGRRTRSTPPTPRSALR